MATKTIAWESGGGYITLTYTGKGSAPISVQSDVNDSFDDRQQVVSIVTTEGSPERAVDLLVKQKGKTYPVGTVFNFDYTGTVQEVTLPAGRYKLQCWGAQGGDSYNYDAIGSKGGYSEGEITLTEVTTFYVFVGGKGGNGSTSSMVNGGWNGGGGSVGYTNLNDSVDIGTSYPACGGGATDIATVTSDMSYSDYRTNRSEASLLSRCIVAGGGGGASAYTKGIRTTTSSDKFYSGGATKKYSQDSTSYYIGGDLPITVGETYVLKDVSVTIDSPYNIAIEVIKDGSISYYAEGQAARIESGTTSVGVRIRYHSAPQHVVSWSVYKREYTVSVENEVYQSNGMSYGGGTSGGGRNPGTQEGPSAKKFGFGSNQTVSNAKYVSGGGGGGWYGGGSARTDLSSSIPIIQTAGSGGSGFVNIADNAQYRPDGYTGLQLDSGSTIDGGNSFPSPSGGNETGHSGNGYARITVIE